MQETLSKENKKLKMLVVQNSFKVCGGVERSLLTFLNLFPKEKYQIDLALLDHLQDEARLFDAIPEHINILPELKQLRRWTPGLMDELRSEGMHKEADIKTFIRDRNKTEQFRKMPIGEKFNKNWEILKEACPLYEGYDIAVAAVNDLPLKIVATRTPGAKKYTFIRIDYAPMFELGFYDKQFVLSEQVYYESMDIIFCLTNQNAESFCRLFPGLSQKVKVLPHVRDKQHMLAQANEYYPPEYYDGVFKILTVARINEQKGIYLLIESAKIIKSIGIDFRWYIIGNERECSYSRNCRSMIDSFGLAADVIILKPRANVFPYYRYCDLYVQTSLFEGMCGTIEEAKILGCPIVTTEFSSVRDQINDCVNGLICSMDSSDIAKTVYHLFCDSEKRKSIADENKKYNGNSRIEEYLAHFTV